MKDILTTAEVAAKAGVTASAVSLAVKAGRISPAHKLPGQRGAFLFTRAAVDAFIEARRAA